MLKYSIIETFTTTFINPMLAEVQKVNSVHVHMDASESRLLRLLFDKDGLEEIKQLLWKCSDMKVMSSVDLTTSFCQVTLEKGLEKIANSNI